MDGGTLYQLRNVINRRNITKKPTGNVTASEEYFLLVTEAHIVTAAMTLFQIDSLKDRPNSLFFPEGCEELPTSDYHAVFSPCCWESAHQVCGFVILSAINSARRPYTVKSCHLVCSSWSLMMQFERGTEHVHVYYSLLGVLSPPFQGQQSLKLCH